MAKPEAPFELPCIMRLQTLEDTVDVLKAELAAIRAAQADHTTQIDEASRRAAEDLANKMIEQNAAILKVSQSMINLQQAVQKWAAAGTLGGAVLFFILAKAAGL